MRFKDRLILSTATGAIILAVALVIGVPAPQAQPPGRTDPTLNAVGDHHYWSWEEPKTGSPVDHYLIEIQQQNNRITFDTTVNSFEIWVGDPKKPYKVRVCGVDKLGREGAWSKWGNYNGGS